MSEQVKGVEGTPVEGELSTGGVGGLPPTDDIKTATGGSDDGEPEPLEFPSIELVGEGVEIDPPLDLEDTVEMPTVLFEEEPTVTPPWVREVRTAQRFRPSRLEGVCTCLLAGTWLVLLCGVGYQISRLLQG